MAKTNYQIFNEENAPERTYNDSEYKEATQRVGGVMPGMALSRMHNKMYYQWSAMCKAIANLIVSHGHDCMDNDVEGITRYLEETIVGAATTEITTHRTAAELDHPEKSVKRKHLADNVYTLPKPEAANNARFLRNDGTWQQVTADNIGACNKADVAGIYRKIGDQIVDRNTDWNTLTEPMTYIVNGASIDDMHHAPSEYNFGVLDVLRTFRDPEKRIIQIYYPHFSQQMLEKGGMWIRFSNNDSWTQWRHIPTKAENDDRYVKKSGDEITGTL